MPLLTPEERIGSTVGGYRLDRLVGEGGMGVVFEATHATLETRVAIKLLHPHLTRDEGTALRFEREARAAAKIRHPNVVRILDFVKAEDGAACIVMDLLTGESLTDRLKRAPLPPEEAAEVLLPIMDAIGYMHESGIVHRDLKPDNIYLSREAGTIVPKLLDFGIAKVLDDSSHVTRTGMVVGTPAYMSPEQARGSKEIGPGVDIWAMGIVWFECIAGHTPFAADGPQAMLAEILTKRPPSLRTVAAHVSPHVGDVIDTALAPKSERFANMRAFSEALKNAFAAPAPSKPPPAKPQQPMPGSPLSSTGPIGTPFPTTRATPQPMDPSVATSDTLLADPSDPTRPSGNQLIPTESAQVIEPTRGGRRGFAVVGLLVGVAAGVGAVMFGMSSTSDATSTPVVAPTAVLIDAGPVDAATDAIFDAVPVDVPLDVPLDATELDARTARTRPSTMMSMTETAMMSMTETAMMESEMQTLPATLPNHLVDHVVRFGSRMLPRVCGPRHASRPNPVSTLDVTFTINPDGRVASDSIRFPPRTDLGLAACVRIQISTWRFSSAQGPTTVTRTLPVL